MENKKLKKKIILALTPLFVLSLVVIISTIPKSFSNTKYEGNYAPSFQSEYAAEEQKPEVPSHEPVYISIFKFIVNCNPFQKETQQ